MSKRVYYPQQQGERKKAKLDITLADHNFDLSQNNNRSKDENHDNWGNEDDDEILLLVSQACEQTHISVDSSLPDYSICMKPSSTSTQNFDPGPSTSTNPDTFKKPTNNVLNFKSTNLKNKCNLISSPLPSISRVIQKTDQNNIIEDMIFNDKVHKGDTNFVYRQILQLQEENSKLKSENGKLLDKYFSKEGEVSILRTQLKNSQVAADSARLEKIKVQEKVQMEWTDKLAAANNLLQDLRTQLDFKNLEITSIKEKCKMLESSKVKLTQVNIPKHDISSSHRNSNMYGISRDTVSSSQLARVKTSSKNVQTECGTLPNIVDLNIVYRQDQKKLIQLLPLTIEPTIEQHSLLEYNEKLQRPSDTLPNRCKVFSTFHRIPNTPSPKAEVKSKVTFSDVYEDLAFIAADEGSQEVEQKFLNIIQATKMILHDVEQTLNILKQRMTTAFQKEIDEKYIEATASLLVVTEEDLISGKPLYKEEQGIAARRIASVLYHVLEHSRAVGIFCREDNVALNCQGNPLIEIIHRICTLLDRTCCAVLYSGFLQAVTQLLYRFLILSPVNITNKIFKVIKTIIQSRPMLFVACEMLRPLRRMASTGSSEIVFCRGGSSGNLKLDYEQGVLLYKKDSCLLQVFLKQIEAALKCIEKQKLREQAVTLCRDLLLFYSDLGMLYDNQEKSSCECRQTFLQVIVFALRNCAAMLTGDATSDSDILSVCRGGLLVLQRCVLRDELCLLAHFEGYLIHFCQLMLTQRHDELYCNMLSEVASTFQSSPEDSPPSFHREPWLRSFQTFSLAD